MSTQPANQSDSSRERERAVMLEDALARPGVREVMRAYQNYQEADRGLDPYRLAASRPKTVTVSNSTNYA